MNPATVGESLAELREIVKTCQAKRIGGSLVDIFTAKAITSIHDKLTPDNRERLERMPIQLAATVAYRMVYTTGP